MEAEVPCLTLADFESSDCPSQLPTGSMDVATLDALQELRNPKLTYLSGDSHCFQSLNEDDENAA